MIWPLRKKFRFGVWLSTMALFPLAALIIAAPVLIAYTAGYTKGTTHSYAQGKIDGYAAACENVQTQTQWAMNVENDLLASRKDTAATGVKVKAVIGATRHFVCTRTVKSLTNIYEP